MDMEHIMTWATDVAKGNTACSAPTEGAACSAPQRGQCLPTPTGDSLSEVFYSEYRRSFCRSNLVNTFNSLDR